MSKSRGSTRNSSATSPRGIPNKQEVVARSISQEELKSMVNGMAMPREGVGSETVLLKDGKQISVTSNASIYRIGNIQENNVKRGSFSVRLFNTKTGQREQLGSVSYASNGGTPRATAWKQTKEFIIEEITKRLNR